MNLEMKHKIVCTDSMSESVVSQIVHSSLEALLATRYFNTRTSTVDSTVFSVVVHRTNAPNDTRVSRLPFHTKQLVKIFRTFRGILFYIFIEEAIIQQIITTY